MNIELRIFIITISILVFLFIVRMLVKKNLSESNSVMWLVIGIIMLISGIFPDLIAKISLFIGISYPPALLFLVAIVMLLVIVFKNTIDLSKADVQIREMASVVSILKEENKKLKLIVGELIDRKHT